MEAKHTPLPWTVDGDSIVALERDIYQTCGEIAIVPEPYEEYDITADDVPPAEERAGNKALIVAAVNACGRVNPANPLAAAEAYEELAAALRAYVKLDNDRRAGCRLTAADWGECFAGATAAIAKAKGE